MMQNLRVYLTELLGLQILYMKFAISWSVNLKTISPSSLLGKIKLLIRDFNFADSF